MRPSSQPVLLFKYNAIIDSRKAVKQRNKERYREMRNKLEEEQQLVDQRRYGIVVARVYVHVVVE